MNSLCVDVTNPGQVLACCGLLELAHALSTGAEGWFSPTGHRFYLTMPGVDTPLSFALTTWVSSRYGDTDDEASEHMTLHLSDTVSLQLDWWQTFPPFKLWAGQMKPASMWSEVQAQWQRAPLEVDEQVLNCGYHGKPALFSFDARRLVRPQDVGYSLNAWEQPFVEHPAVEFLAFVGLQRFQPKRTDDGQWVYRVWTSPLPVAVAAQAFRRSFDWPGVSGTCSVVNRGGKFKATTWATVEKAS